MEELKQVILSNSLDDKIHIKTKNHIVQGDRLKTLQQASNYFINIVKLILK